jgi:predicted nuclease with TOPRIM domain
MAEKLKREFIELLETDKEFRYTVAGYLGLSEVLRRMDRMEERMLALEERMLKLEERMLRVEENQERLWEAVKRLEENQERLWEAVKRLEENQRKLWEAVKGLEEGQNKLWRYVKSGFKELREMLGVTFEATARAFIDVLLDEMGYPEASVSVKHFAVDGEVVEVDAFCEDPLVVGEIPITSSQGTRPSRRSRSSGAGSPSSRGDTAGGSCWLYWWWPPLLKRSALT